MNVHLDAARFAALLREPAAHDELLEHLAAGCDECDAFLATHADAFDGPVDALLFSLAPPAPPARDDLAWARLQRALRGPTPRHRRVAVVAVAAGVALAVGVALLRPHPPATDVGVKGPGAPQLELSAAVRANEGRFEALADAARVSSHGVLVFRARSTVDGVARVFLQAGSGAPRELGVVRVRAGLHELERDDGLLGIDLSGEAGPVTVWLVVGESPMTAGEALSALQSHGTSELAVAQVHVFVEP
ncbi:MAG: hypothetical protein AB1730_28445 [Myxococcota bacterium]